MRILVTGGAGFIGSHLVDRLVREGHTVSVVDNLVTGKKRNLNREAKFYKTDIRSSTISKIFERERPEVVAHYAAQMDVRHSVADPIFDANVNIVGLLNIVQNAVKFGVRRVLFASSGGAVYGEQEVFPAPENHPTRPLSPYGITKITGEYYLYFYKQVSGLDYAAFRYGNVYGPRQDPHGEAGVIAIFSEKLLRGEQPVIYGTGKQTRDYVYVDDVVEANLLALDRPTTDAFNVGTGRETSVNELFRLLVRLTGSKAKETHGPERPGEQFRSVVDASKIGRVLGWAPKVPLEEGLRRTVEYFRETLS